LGHFWSFRGVFGRFWFISGHFGAFWIILVRFWTFLSHIGPFLAILGQSKLSFPNILNSKIIQNFFPEIFNSKSYSFSDL